MGDRAQVRIKTGEDHHSDDIYLYTHWGGSNLPQLVREAISRGERWGDPEYLSRIIFSEMTRGDLEPTGYGIGTERHGDVHTVVEVDVSEQMVREKNVSGFGDNQTLHVTQNYAFGDA